MADTGGVSSRRLSRRDGSDALPRCGRCGSMDMVRPEDIFCAYCRRKYTPTPEQVARHARALEAVKAGLPPPHCAEQASSAPTTFGHDVSNQPPARGADADKHLTGHPKPSALTPAKAGGETPGTGARMCRESANNTQLRQASAVDAAASARTSSASVLLAAADRSATNTGAPRARRATATKRGRELEPTGRRSGPRKGSRPPPVRPPGGPPGEVGSLQAPLVRWAQCDACEAWRIVDSICDRAEDVERWASFDCAAIGKACDTPDDLPPAAPAAGPTALSAAEAARRAELRANAAQMWADLDRYFEELGPEVLAVLRTAGTPEGAHLARRREVQAQLGADSVSAAGTGANDTGAAAGAPKPRLPMPPPVLPAARAGCTARTAAREGSDSEGESPPDAAPAAATMRLHLVFGTEADKASEDIPSESKLDIDTGASVRIRFAAGAAPARSGAEDAVCSEVVDDLVRLAHIELAPAGVPVSKTGPGAEDSAPADSLAPLEKRLAGLEAQLQQVAAANEAVRERLRAAALSERARQGRAHELGPGTSGGEDSPSSGGSPVKRTTPTGCDPEGLHAF